MFIRILCTVILTALSFSAHAQQVVRAYTGEFSPFIISEGKYKDQGVVDEVVSFFESNMDNFKFDRIPASFKRGMEDMKTGRKQGCTFALLKLKDREGYLDFSEPYLLLSDVGLTIHKDHKKALHPYIDGAGELDLEAALQNKAFFLHYYQSRRYNPYINSVLKAEIDAGNSNIIFSTKDEWINQRFQTILRKQPYAFILYPEEAHYTATGFGLADDIVFLKIKNGRGFSKTHIACTKGSWNDSFMLELDRLIIEYRNKEAILKHHHRWMPEDAVAAHLNEIKRIWP